LNLINTVVDLSRLEADRLVLAFKPVDLSGVVAKVLASGQAAAQPVQVELVADIPKTMPALWGDPDRIEQMILHLINFILKRKSGGQICLSAGHDQKMATIKIAADEVITSPDEMAELFQLGVHVDSSGHSSLGKGGLTLPLAFGLAQKQHGQLWVESQAGVGTAFYLQLPLQQPS
jgi:signal transduction histidine kinase